MFKLIALMVSLALVGAGGVAITAPDYLDSNIEGNGQVQTSLEMEAQNTLEAQESSNVFLDKDTNFDGNIDAEATVEVETEATIEADEQSDTRYEADGAATLDIEVI